MPHEDYAIEAYGASATPSELTSSHLYQNQPTLIVAYQTTGHNPRRNANSKKQELQPKQDT